MLFIRQVICQVAFISCWIQYFGIPLGWFWTCDYKRARDFLQMFLKVKKCWKYVDWRWLLWHSLWQKNADGRNVEKTFYKSVDWKVLFVVPKAFFHMGNGQNRSRLYALLIVHKKCGKFRIFLPLRFLVKSILLSLKSTFEILDSSTTLISRKIPLAAGKFFNFHNVL